MIAMLSENERKGFVLVKKQADKVELYVTFHNGKVEEVSYGVPTHEQGKLPHISYQKELAASRKGK